MDVELGEGYTREACPTCGSGHTVALLIGDFVGTPRAIPTWVEQFGCVHPGFDHRCEACGYTWCAGLE